ncbi:MAG: YfhO family protein [Acidobacteriota bacterium]|nr:YfhO family protein [Acidobacteriota bacterium]
MRAWNLNVSNLIHCLHKESIGAPFFFLAATVVFFFPAFFLGHVPTAIDIAHAYWPVFRRPGDSGLRIPKNSHMMDIVIFETWYDLGRRALRQGEFPLWSPWDGCGVPLMANMQSAVFYPGTWFVYLLGPRRGLALLYAFKLFWIGLFTYMYLRTTGVSTAPALLGGFGFMFSGPSVGWLYWPLASNFFFIPLSLWIIEKFLILEYRPYRFLGFYALGWAMAFFGGHPETLLHISALGAFYCLIGSGTRGWKRLFAHMGILGMAHLIGLSVAAVQLFPALEYLWHSFEWTARQEWAHPPAINWRLIIGSFLPDFYGNPSGTPIRYYAPFLSRALGPSFVGNYNDVTGGYVGITLLLLGLTGVAALVRKDPYVAFFTLALSVIGLVVYRGPLLYWVVNRLPLFSRSWNMRLVLLISFCLVVLASRYLQAWLTSMRPSLALPAVVALATVGTLLLLWHANFTVLTRLDLPYPLARLVPLHVLWLALTVAFQVLTLGALWLLRSGGRAWGFLLLGGLVGTQTMAHARLYAPQWPADQAQALWETPPGFADIRRLSEADPMPWRTTALGRRPWWEFYGLKMTTLYPASLGAYYGIPDIRHYDAIQVYRYRRLLGQVAAGYLFHWMDLRDIRSGFLDFVGVKYLVADFDPNAEDPGHWARVRAYNGYALWVNRRVRPRAFLASGVTWVNTPEEAFARVTAPDFDWHGPVVIERKGARGFPAGDYPGETPRGHVRFQVYRPHQVRLEVWTDRPAFLVLTDTFYPGWKAFVDGRPTEIWAANYAFRAVYVGPGHHEVEFRYVPISFIAGATVSGLTASGLVLWGILRRRSQGPT